MRVIVQKFGGTSIATPEGRLRLSARVEAALGEGLRPVVVVSAMGRRGDPYATDTLLDFAREHSPELPARERDLLMACGELISAAVVTGVLVGRGIPARALTGGQAGIRTDGRYGEAAIRGVDPRPLLGLLEQGMVPVVAGFQGEGPEGDFTTLGRGGSDTTAAALAGALRAESCEIYTDVDGLMTADPRVLPEAWPLPVATYDEAAQMAHAGARVVHPRAVELAMQSQVPLRIRSTFSDAPGTLVTYAPEAAGLELAARRPQGPVTGVTYVPHLAQVQLEAAPEDGRSQEALRRLAEAGISIDLINLSPGRQVFCVDQGQADRARALLRDLGLSPRIRTGCAKVSVVGAGMRGRPGVMATVVESLTRAGVTILQTADSHVTISCLVREEDLAAAVRALHTGFGLGQAGGR